ncbi:MAG: F0F1 ATP synthase subunit B' [Xanthobacteraceae bacterium]
MAETKTGTEAHGGAKAPFPPFNPETFASQLFWLAIAFVALYVLLSRFALPRVASIFAARSQRVKSDLATAERLKSESEAAIAAYEKALAEARARAQAIASATRAEFAKAAEERKKKLEASLNAKLAEAERQIEATKKSAMANVRGIALDTAVEIIKRLVGEAPNKQLLERAVDTALH